MTLISVEKLGLPAYSSPGVPVNIIHAKAEHLGLRYLVIGGHTANREPRWTLISWCGGYEEFKM